MSILSVGYMIFVFVGIMIFYLIPQKAKPFWILILSLSYVFTASLYGVFFIIASSLVAYFSALFISKSQDKILKKRILIFSVIFCLGILVALKYLVELPIFQNFIIYDNENWRISDFVKNILYPIGLSYYTLQIISYVLDVYWQRIEVEKSYFKVLIFTCYFPQLVQGPISKYSELAPEIFKEHKFSWINLKFGVQLIIWGMFKKFVIADRVGDLVNNTFYSGETPYGFAVWLGLLYFGIQLYCDFSGGIDIIRGVSQSFGINLKENFRQPYFSRSLGEFWRRWHISLGEWMKDYVFYPISISNSLNKIKKYLKKIISRKAANRVGMAIALFIVFAFVGIWHGTGTNFLGWGLYNGTILAISALLADEYIKWKKTLKINEESLYWKSFTTLRTFIIVTIGWAFDCADTISGSFEIIGNAFIFEKSNIAVFKATVGIYAQVLFSSIIVLFIDIISYNNIDIRAYLNQKNYFVQVLFWSFFIQIIIAFGFIAKSGGFMYANF